MTWNNVTLRERERASIEDFVVANADKFVGNVLDFGCGKQPYRAIVEAAGGVYHGYDRASFPASTVEADEGSSWPAPQKGKREKGWGAILCTQVIQYVPNSLDLLRFFRTSLADDGWLVMTGPTNWPEVEKEDLWRFTVNGIAYLMESVGFGEITIASREAMMLNDIGLSLGWGATGQRRKLP